MTHAYSCASVRGTSTQRHPDLTPASPVLTGTLRWASCRKFFLGRFCGHQHRPCPLSPCGHSLLPSLYTHIPAPCAHVTNLLSMARISSLEDAPDVGSRAPQLLRVASLSAPCPWVRRVVAQTHSSVLLKAEWHPTGAPGALGSPSLRGTGVVSGFGQLLRALTDRCLWGHDSALLWDECPGEC